MVGENGSPVTPDWQPTPKPWPVGTYEAPTIPANITLGAE